MSFGKGSRKGWKRTLTNPNRTLTTDLNLSDLEINSQSFAQVFSNSPARLEIILKNPKKLWVTQATEQIIGFRLA